MLSICLQRAFCICACVHAWTFQCVYSLHLSSTFAPKIWSFYRSLLKCENLLICPMKFVDTPLVIAKHLLVVLGKKKTLNSPVRPCKLSQFKINEKRSQVFRLCIFIHDAALIKVYKGFSKSLNVNASLWLICSWWLLFECISLTCKDIDGAYFGTTFPHLFLMTYGHLKPPKPTQNYVPRVFGFKLHKPWFTATCYWASPSLLSR